MEKRKAGGQIKRYDVISDSGYVVLERIAKGDAISIAKEMSKAPSKTKFYAKPSKHIERI